MAQMLVIAGESGTGKSSSIAPIPELGIKGLDPKTTAIINVGGKALPFKGWAKSYGTPISKGGNYAATSNSEHICLALQMVNKNEAIANVVIDDFQFIMSDELLGRANESGYEKFSIIAANIMRIINTIKAMRPDMNVIILTHIDRIEKESTYKLKTVGKMLDDKFVFQGLFTTVLYSMVEFSLEENKAKYYFITNHMMNDKGMVVPAKSPHGMFDSIRIPNDLGYVVEQLRKYNLGE